MLEPLDKLETLKILIRIDPFSPLDPFYGIEETDLLIIPDRPWAQA
jgi:hypothetical protein